jgi:hypothetical protein
MRPDWRIAVAPIAVTLFVTMLRIFSDGGGFELLSSDPDALLRLDGLTPILWTGGGAAPIFAGACAGLWVAVFLAGSAGTRAALVAGAIAAASAGDRVASGVAPLVGGDFAGYLATAGIFAAVAGAVAYAVSRFGGREARPSLNVTELRRAGLGGAGALGFTVILLLEAWMIGAVCKDLSTADYLVALFSAALPPVMLPLLLFAIACAVSFATGSSWSTMSILLPNVVALASALGGETVIGSFGMVVISIGAVLDGSIFGDHCSPISDTTVLSSVASGADHVDHVRTQAPYAVFTAAVAVLCGYLPTVLLADWNFGLAVASAAAAICALLWGWGRRVPEVVEV